MKRLLFSFSFFISIAASAQSEIAFPSTAKPLVFAPGFITDGFENRDMAIAPTNNELFFTIQHKAFSVIMRSVKSNNKWSKPEVASFSGKFHDLEAAYSADGKKLFFISDRPLNDTATASKDYDIWYVEKKGNSWGTPVNAGRNINTAKDEFYPSLARNGNLYFTRENDSTKEDIFVAALKGNSYSVPEALPSAINSPGYDFNAYVDTDEEFIIFSSYKRKDDHGGGDLYISIKKEGEWQPAKNMGDAINSTVLDYCPFVSFDKNHFFFTTKRITIDLMGKKPLTAKSVYKLLSEPGNGSDDIYIMDFQAVLNKLKQ